MSNKLKLNQWELVKFSAFARQFMQFSAEELTFLYESYITIIEIIEIHLEAEHDLKFSFVNNEILILYLLHDFIYRQELLGQSLVLFKDNELEISRFLNSVTDKYTSLTSFKYTHDKLLSRYSMPISSLSLYLNFILVTLQNLTKKHERSLLLKLLQKSFIYAETISELLVSGFEAEALGQWRSLFELEAILALLTDENVLALYERHLTYSAAFSKLLNKEVTDEIFVEIKSEMAKLGLKSKDTKRFIEYGFIRAHKDFTSDNNFTFKYGIQQLAGLERYAEAYQLASEVAHSSPLFLLQSKAHLTVTVLTLVYETFLRLEELFFALYQATATAEEKTYYQQIRAIYLSDITRILNREKKKLN